MNENVLTLPIQRKRGHRHVNPIASNGGATVLNFDSRGAETETAEQRLARIDEATERVAHAMLVAMRAVREISELARHK
ncbi:hypothetical protein PQR33_32970 [Paraburkholderia sediminicola]|uniref:hypothetical protein n=1 Tax=Paraburkholderia sediminicola TaxID=458836 RepID=UPI0038BA5A47